MIFSFVIKPPVVDYIHISTHAISRNKSMEERQILVNVQAANQEPIYKKEVPWVLSKALVCYTENTSGGNALACRYCKANQYFNSFTTVDS